MPQNRLANETSPYLQQHADNPVDWYPWGEEALNRARAEDKPILLSIGYSACHWCHVMAHESFEDPATAQVMNELFVNIKVDREERPDLDRIYQTAHALLSQRSGGWPLTVFLTPDDHTPFFAGTYFPREARYGLPGFVELLHRIDALYRTRRTDIATQNASLRDALGRIEARAAMSDDRLDASALDQARGELARAYDRTYGGIGGAPKFPHAPTINRLLRHWSATARDGRADDKALEMAIFTLERMAEGGLYDHLGGGFARYSVDEKWMIPHFEKMLYDNGPLLALYAEAHAATGDPALARVATETADWVMRDMQSPEGGYYSALDADSEGVEGKFYVWTREEVHQVVGADDYPLFAARYGLDRPANFEGQWHLYGAAEPAALAAGAGLTEDALRERLDRARARLLERRETRVHPGLDDKVLTAWNALMIRGMAVAARHLGRADWADSAQRALDFIRTQLWRDGRLLATYKDGRAHLPAYLDDHAFLLDAVLELLALRWRSADLDFAVQLADVLLEHFEDEAHGGFYFTADDHEQLLQRPKPTADESLPSGNGVAAYALARLGHLLAEPHYLDAAQRALQAAAGVIGQSPSAHCTLLDALEEELDPPTLLLLRGPLAELAPWQQAAAGYAPTRLTLAIPSEERGLPAALADKPAPARGVYAYLCRGTHCEAPITDPAELHKALG
ncbi:thioredoxin domain-containing protein [Acidihalobacter ferrooxydans]|uniref:Thioredoxin domain-containing protein n=1 Tax=Acidihalobacter ferrooxydans TaxID=1765967 RepID=A0A1P8UIP0_9GAMM|nr:thioredoxin domain-containing protein [Acidihalobacter ferrooxydans]APZ43700.1 thioredoxin domain-containing protein [Acidihalobacter ferrooxydans]